MDTGQGTECVVEAEGAEPVEGEEGGEEGVSGAAEHVWGRRARVGGPGPVKNGRASTTAVLDGLGCKRPCKKRTQS